MTDTPTSSLALRLLVAVLVCGALVAAGWWVLEEKNTWPRGEALTEALRPLIDKQGNDQSLVARIIRDSYLETRSDASRWSGVYWGCVFAAAALSALAALVLKFETVFKSEAVKKDIAATLSVCAALLITISTSGDFQRKWQANRIAAAELERTGYEFLEKDGVNPRSFLAPVAQTLLRRQMAIVGSTEQRSPPPAEVARGASQTK
jgi:Protein of unknown function (DUF4231)